VYQKYSCSIHATLKGPGKSVAFDSYPVGKIAKKSVGVSVETESLKKVDNFKYFGGWMMSSLKDEIRKTLAWSASSGN